MHVENIGDGRAFVIRGFFSPDECRDWIARAEAEGFEADAPITTPRGFEHRPDIRNNARLIADRTDWADEIWARLGPVFPSYPGVRVTGLNERFRFYRYDVGQRFAPHRDGYYARPDGSERSVWTLLIYLNGDFEGGETRIFSLDAEVKPEPGLALVFVHALVHEGAAVRSGRKYVLRSDVMIETRS
jgi:prolyl 4-hydroxylase